MHFTGKNTFRDVALWRFGVISPLLHHSNDGVSLHHELEKLSERIFLTPKGEPKQYSANTFRDWLYLYRKYGIDGLMGKERNDKGSTAIPKPLQEKFVALRKKYPSRTTKRLLRELEKMKVWDGISPSSNSFYRFAARNNLQRNPTSPPDSVSPFEFEEFGDMWMADFMHGPKLVKGTKHIKTYLHAILDDATRYIVQARFHLAENIEALISDLMMAVRRFGVPLRFYTDNGAAFRSIHLKQVAARLGIHLPHTPAYKPRGRGKEERFFRTVRDQYTSGLRPKTLEELNAGFQEWLSEYHGTVHSSLAVSPLNQRLIKNNGLKQLSDIQNVDALFRMETEKKIYSNGCIRLKNKQYEIKGGLPGQKIQVYYVPWDMSVIYFGDEHIAAMPVNKQQNAKRFQGPKRGGKEKK
jgi:transposase InsO family protein